jgi:hypothetical protein
MPNNRFANAAGARHTDLALPIKYNAESPEFCRRRENWSKKNPRLREGL